MPAGADGNVCYHFKFLGLIIDSNLKWQNHIEHCKAKISSSLYIMNQVKNVLPIKQLLIQLEVLCKGHSGSHSLHFVMARRQGIMKI